MNAHDVELPWYRQFWPWFLIAIPGLAVVGGISTVFIAFTHDDAFVVDDYRHIALATERNRVRDDRARDLGVSAALSFAPDAVRVELGYPSAAALPDALQLRLWHPTLAERDRQILLTQTGDRTYAAPVTTPLSGRWHVELTALAPAGDAWRLSGTLTTGSRTLRLEGRGDGDG